MLQSLLVGLARFRITQNEGVVFRDVLVVGPRESLGLVRFVVIGANECLNLGRLHQTVYINASLPLIDHDI